MSYWLEDYKSLNDNIHYLEFKLTDPLLSKEKKEDAHLELMQLVQRLNTFEKLVKHFKGIEHRILVKKYIEGKTLKEIAIELKFSESYVTKVHAQLQRQIKFANEE